METFAETDTNLQDDHYGSSNDGKREGGVARAIEKQTSKIPSDVFLWAAGASIIGALAFQFIGRGNKARELITPRRAPTAVFVGMWAPTLLMLGLYNKIVKVLGSDRVTE